jgi:hypothetical protein
MATPRRRLIRPASPLTNHRAQSERKAVKLRSRLEAERAVLARWMTRLRRAVHAVEKAQRTITRIERQLACSEES